MFAVFTKALWLLLKPSFLMLLAAAYGLWQLRRGRLASARRWLLGSLAAIAICGLTTLSDLLIRPLEERFPRPDLTGAQIAGIIVLGGADEEPIATSRNVLAVNDAAARYIEAAELAVRFPNARLVFSGGGDALRKSQPEAKMAGRMFEELGLAPSRITLESRSLTTWENAIYTKQLISQAPGERWLLVTSAWHMPRAMGTFRKAGLSVEAYPVDYRTTANFKLWRINYSVGDGLRRFDYVLKEYPGLLGYWLSGRSTALFPEP